MADSAAFQTGSRRGVIILQGLNILTCEPLLDVAGHLAFYLDEGFDLLEGIRRCKQYSLQGRSLWLPGRLTDNEYLASFEARDNHAFLRQYSHEEVYAPDQRQAVPLGNIVATMSGNERLSKATVAKDLIRDLNKFFEFGPKPRGSVAVDPARVNLGAISAKAGSAIADPIILDAISAKAGSAIDVLLLGAKQALGVPAKAPPALAAVTVGACKYTDVRVKQEAERKAKEEEETSAALARSFVRDDPLWTAAILA